MILLLIERNHLQLIGGSEAMYGGACPFCGRERSFTLWSEKGTYRCFWCGCDGAFAMTPERVAAERKAQRLTVEGMVL